MHATEVAIDLKHNYKIFFCKLHGNHKAKIGYAKDQRKEPKHAAIEKHKFTKEDSKRRTEELQDSHRRIRGQRKVLTYQ